MKIRSAIPVFVLAVLTSATSAQSTTDRQDYRAEMLQDASARAAIPKLLDAMSDAVVKGDQAAYLEHIWQGDGVYATEQRAWAEDLTRDVPETFELIATDLNITWKPGDENGKPEQVLMKANLTAHWRMPKGSDRKVEFPVRFIEVDGRWLYAGRSWDVLESDGVRVVYAEGLQPVAERVIADLPAIIDHVHEGFELQRDPERVQEVKLYSSMRELQFSIYPSYVESLGGWNEPGESIKLLTRANARGRQLQSLLAHEYGHVASFLLGDKIVDAPWWVLEGIAELSSEHVGMSWRATNRTIRRLASEDGLVEWERMADFHNVDRGVVRMAYVQGHHIMGYVSERFGRSARNTWLRAMARGAGLDDATREAFDISFDELDRQWRASLLSDEATGESGL